MSLVDRCDTVATVLADNSGEGSFGRRTQGTGGGAVTTWRCRKYKLRPRTEEVMLTKYGLEPNVTLVGFFGEANSAIVEKQIIQVGSNRYQILGADPQVGMDLNGADHLHLVAKELFT